MKLSGQALLAVIRYYYYGVRLSPLEVRVGGSIKDAAQVIIRALDSDVTILTPSTSPGVLHLPEINTVVSAVTNSQHTVVKSLSALASEDTRLVGLEGQLVGLDGNSNGLLSDSRHQSINRSSSDISVTLGSRARDNGASSDASARLASGSGSVGIVRLSADTALGSNIVEGIIHPATIAASIATINITRHQLLLREGSKRSVLVVVSTLQSTSGRERPARSTVALVLDSSDGTSSGPVNRGGKRRTRFGDVLRARGVSSQIGSSGATNVNSGNELIISEVGELIHTQLVSLSGISIVSLKLVQVVGEDRQSLDELSTRRKLQIEADHVIKKFLFIEFHWSGINSQGSSSKRQQNNFRQHFIRTYE